MNVLVVGRACKELDLVGDALEVQDYAVYSTASTLRALDVIKNVSLKAVICGHDIQIIDVLKFPRWILTEAGRLPPYFVLSKKLTWGEIAEHENGPMITGLFNCLEEMKDLKNTLRGQRQLVDMPWRSSRGVCVGNFLRG